MVKPRIFLHSEVEDERIVGNYLIEYTSPRQQKWNPSHNSEDNMP